MKDKIIEVLKKLLRLSKSSNEHEAAHALSKAVELSAKYGIELEKLNGLEFESKIGKDICQDYKYLQDWERKLYKGIADLFGCRSLVRGYGQKKAVVFAGHDTDRELAIYTACYLRGALIRLYKDHKHDVEEGCEGQYDRKKARNAFLYGCSERVLEKATQLFSKIPDQDSFGASALIQKKGYAVDRWLEAQGVTCGRKRSIDLDDGIMLKGYMAGNKVSIHRAVEGSKSEQRQLA